MLRPLIIAASLIGASIGTANAAAGTILSPVSAIAGTQTPGPYGIGNTINQSGLSTGFISGVTNFDSYLATSPLHDIAASDEWFGAAGTTTDFAVWDLGSAVTFDRIAHWNEESSGIGLLNISTSNDGVTFTSLLSGIMPPDNPLAPYPATVYSFGAVTARYFRFDMSACPQINPGSYPSCAIGEVAVRTATASVPAPAALSLFGLGAVALGLGRRRR